MIKLKEADLLVCCGSPAWARQMAEHSFPNVKEVFATGDSIWWSLDPTDWREAFRAHSKTPNASIPLHAEQRSLHHEYEQKFGYPFVMCATGKTPHAVLEAMHARLAQDPGTELKIAAEQQRQITHQRLKRLLGPYK